MVSCNELAMEEMASTTKLIVTYIPPSKDLWAIAKGSNRSHIWVIASHSSSERYLDNVVPPWLHLVDDLHDHHYYSLFATTTGLSPSQPTLSLAALPSLILLHHPSASSSSDGGGGGSTDVATTKTTTMLEEEEDLWKTNTSKSLCSGQFDDDGATRSTSTTNSMISSARDSFLVYVGRQRAAPCYEKQAADSSDDDDDDDDDTVSTATATSVDEEDEDDECNSVQSSLSSSSSSTPARTPITMTKRVTFANQPVTAVYTRPVTTAHEKYYLYYDEYDYLDFKLHYVSKGQSSLCKRSPRYRDNSSSACKTSIAFFELNQALAGPVG